MLSPTPSLKELFNISIQNELSAGNIYRKLSTLFSEIPEISVFWTQLEEDEKDHALILSDILILLPEDKHLSPADSTVYKNAILVKNILGTDLISGVHTLEDAYSLANQLETSEVNSIFKYLTLPFISNPQKKSLIEMQINDHLKRLSTFTEVFGDKTWRLQIKIKHT